MATDATSPGFSLEGDSDLFKSLDAQVRAVAAPLASLRFTVTLFALSVVLIFIGTLAQAQPGMNMWRVIDKYFRSYLVMVDASIFFVPGWFPVLHKQIPEWIKFPFPGGFTIGLAMAVNLFAAHWIRFKVQAAGPRLGFGLLLLALGTAITYLVIASGYNADALQSGPPFEWTTLWQCVRVAIVLGAVASLMALVLINQPTIGQRILYALSTLVLGGLAFAAWKMIPGESSMRILWQLIQGGLSALVLLGGCYLVFKKRAGIVLLHAGIGLMMFSEFFVSRYVVEGRMTIREDETVNYIRDIREVELAIIKPSKEDSEDVIVVPGSRLRPRRSLFGKSQITQEIAIQDKQLPFDIYVEEYLKNTTLVDLDKLEKENLANKGTGLEIGVKEIPAADGTESDVDFAAAFVEFKKRGSGESLGKYLLAQLISSQDIAEKVELDGETYEVSLRFKREYKPYKISLKDVRKDDYQGTDTPMNYSSDVVLTRSNLESDKESKVGDFHIWMNNPLRYSGETFYQSGYDDGDHNKDGIPEAPEATTLQVVSNTGWMMPYIGCMLVAVGMTFHFSGTLWRFLDKSITAQLTAGKNTQVGWVSFAVPVGLVVIFGGYAISKFRPPSDTKSNMKIHQFGKLPVIYQGRVKPIDSLARNALRIVSNREYMRVAPYEEASMFREVGEKKPAIQWLLDVISGAPEAREHRVFRIDNLDVQKTLGLPRRKRFRYALSEFREKLPEMQKQLMAAREVPKEELSLYQKKLFELEKRLNMMLMLQAAFLPQPVPPMATLAELADDRQAAMQKNVASLNVLRGRQQELRRMQPPLAIPTSEESDWESFSTAWGNAFVTRYANELSQQLGMPVPQQDVPEATFAWANMLRAYGDVNVNEFNDAVFGYQELIAEKTPTIKNAEGEFTALSLSKIKFEHLFNSAQMFMSSIVMYLIAFLLVAVGWATTASGKSFTFQRGAYWLIMLAFVVHTAALIGRIYISGRPPITNLYSSAVFIGWATVGVGLVIEFFMRMGIGNALAAISGYSTLLIAYNLAADGDTFTVLQAVLDTQFWLATHVVCITLGYAATFVAGLLAVFYIVSQIALKNDATDYKKVSAKELTSATYGVLCFAIFFSFVGTVLGGLWADDSWGRFWGWDPKENGALMIVLWNALILHARWGGIIRQKGMALLAVAGNIVTAWSWFGVNELGVGLHSYGFTEGVLRNLSLFVGSQLLLILVGAALLQSYKKKVTTA